MLIHAVIGEVSYTHRGNKGALIVPLLSFQYHRRPGCAAKLLCFHTAGGFESHLVHHLCNDYATWTHKSHCFARPRSQAAFHLNQSGTVRTVNAGPPAPLLYLYL